MPQQLVETCHRKATQLRQLHVHVANVHARKVHSRRPLALANTVFPAKMSCWGKGMSFEMPYLVVPSPMTSMPSQQTYGKGKGWVPARPSREDRSEWRMVWQQDSGNLSFSDWTEELFKMWARSVLVSVIETLIE